MKTALRVDRLLVLFLLILPALVPLGGCCLVGGSCCSCAGADGPPILLLNITSSGKADPHSVTMALQLAGHALDDGRKVVLFFNVRGVDVPTKAFPEDAAFHTRPIRDLLADLMERGAEAHVCPHCMQALGVSPEDLVEGALVTDREKLFSRVRPETAVFTY